MVYPRANSPNKWSRTAVHNDLQQKSNATIDMDSLCSRGGTPGYSRGVLPYISYIGMCRPKLGMVFEPFWSENGYRF